MNSKRKVAVLNAALLACAGWMGWTVYQGWQSGYAEAGAQQAGGSTLANRFTLPAERALTASGSQVIQRNPFSRDRNINVDTNLDDGVCKFRAAWCINNTDARVPACYQSDVSTMEVEQPFYLSDAPVDRANIAAIQSAIGPGGLGPYRKRCDEIAAGGYDGFTLGAPGAGPGGAPKLVSTTAKPPFTADGSGLPVKVAGDSFLRLRFSNMTIADASGKPVYAGPTDLHPTNWLISQVVRSGERGAAALPAVRAEDGVDVGRPAGGVEGAIPAEALGQRDLVDADVLL